MTHHFRRRATAAGAAASRIPWRSAHLFPWRLSICLRRRHAMPAALLSRAQHPTAVGRPLGSPPAITPHQARELEWRRRRRRRHGGRHAPLEACRPPGRVSPDQQTLGSRELILVLNDERRNALPPSRACLTRTTESLTQSTPDLERSFLIRRFLGTPGWTLGVVSLAVRPGTSASAARWSSAAPQDHRPFRPGHPPSRERKRTPARIAPAMATGRNRVHACRRSAAARWVAMLDGAHDRAGRVRRSAHCTATLGGTGS